MEWLSTAILTISSSLQSRTCILHPIHDSGCGLKTNKQNKQTILHLTSEYVSKNNSTPCFVNHRLFTSHLCMLLLSWCASSCGSLFMDRKIAALTSSNSGSQRMRFVKVCFQTFVPYVANTHFCVWIKKQQSACFIKSAPCAKFFGKTFLECSRGTFLEGS